MGRTRLDLFIVRPIPLLVASRKADFSTPLTAVREKGVIFFQNLVKEALMSHHALEVAAGDKIFPALQQSRGETAEDLFCKQLESPCGPDPKLAW